VMIPRTRRYASASQPGRQRRKPSSRPTRRPQCEQHATGAARAAAIRWRICAATGSFGRGHFQLHFGRRFAYCFFFSDPLMRELSRSSSGVSSVHAARASRDLVVTIDSHPSQAALRSSSVRFRSWTFLRAGAHHVPRALRSGAGRD